MEPDHIAARLADAVSDLAAISVESCGADVLRALVTQLVVEQSRLAVAVGQVLVEWERRGEWQADGTLRPERALARETHSRDRSKQEQLRLADRLTDMPLVREAVLAGRLSMDHAALFARAATPSRMELFRRDEAVLIDLCAGHVLFADSQRLVQYWMHAADDELGIEHRRPDPSTLYLSRSETSGEGFLDGHLTAVDTEIVAGELRRLELQVRREDKRDGVKRTAAQRRAAALVRMASRSVNATGISARPLFQVIIGDQTARRLCESATGVVFHPDDLVPHIDRAVIESFLFDGRTTVIARSNRRTFTGALRSAIQVRDRRCQHRSGCDTPAVYSDVDHRLPASRGGPTTQFNGRSECVPHNRLAHLHDDDEPMPERTVDYLESVRCKIRWQYQQDMIEHPEWFEDPDPIDALS